MNRNKPQPPENSEVDLPALPPAGGLDSGAAAEAPLPPKTQTAKQSTPPAANQNKAPSHDAQAPSRYAQMKAKMAHKARTVKTYAVEIFNEHDLWVEALAVKGGASALVAAGIVGLSYVVALPFMLAATVVAACGGLIGLGVYGMAAGGARAWDSLRSTIARIRGQEPPPHLQGKKRDIFQRLQNTTLVKKIRESKTAKAITSTRAWKVSEKFMRQSEESILGSLALGGAVATLAVGATLLATQVLVLPIVAIGATATFAAVEAVTMIASGGYGLYLCYENFKHRRAAKHAARAGGNSTPDAAPAVCPLKQKAKGKKGNSPLREAKITDAFAEKASPAAQETPPEAPAGKSAAAKKPAAGKNNTDKNNTPGA